MHLAVPYCDPACAGPPLLANTPINILTSTGQPVRNDNTTSAAWVGIGNGTSPPELYTAYDPNNLGSYDPILPGETALLQNLQTGKYCQLRSMPANATQLGMFCDQPTPATATVMTYTGSGLSYNGIPLVDAGLGTPLLLANTTTAPPGPNNDNLSFPPAGALGRLAVCCTVHVVIVGQTNLQLLCWG